MLTRDDTTYQPDVSEQQLLCAGVGSISGGNAYNVDDYAVSTGVVLESELPYTQQNTSPLWPLASGWQNRVFKASSDYTMFSQGTSLSYLKACLKTYGPLTIHCVVPQDWYNLQDSSGSGNHEGRHCRISRQCERSWRRILDRQEQLGIVVERRRESQWVRRDCLRLGAFLFRLVLALDLQP